MSDTTPTLTKEQIEAYHAQRLKECVEKINALLEQYGCKFVAVPEIVDGRIVATVALQLK